MSTMFKDGKELAPHQRRVVTEKHELDEKRAKLRDFIGGAIYQSLPEAERNRLVQQDLAMMAYSKILGQRIEAF